MREQLFEGEVRSVFQCWVTGVPHQASPIAVIVPAPEPQTMLLCDLRDAIFAGQVKAKGSVLIPCNPAFQAILGSSSWSLKLATLVVISFNCGQISAVNASVPISPIRIVSCRCATIPVFVVVFVPCGMMHRSCLVSVRKSLR